MRFGEPAKSARIACGYALAFYVHGVVFCGEICYDKAMKNRDGRETVRSCMNMKEYVIEKTVGAPDWTKVPELKVDNICWLPDAGVRMEQQICHDDEKIYVHQVAHEKNIRAELTDKLGSICTDSCMEFFFSPVPEDGRYFNIELNLNGAIFLGFGHGRADSIRLIPEDHKKLFNIRTDKTADGWEIFYEIPLEFLHVFYPDYDFKSGRVIRANCFKCGDLTVQPHYMMWSDTTSETPDFHRPQDFGRMIFA